jgi:hypothetical protein
MATKAAMDCRPSVPTSASPGSSRGGAGTSISHRRSSRSSWEKVSRVVAPVFSQLEFYSPQLPASGFYSYIHLAQRKRFLAHVLASKSGVLARTRLKRTWGGLALPASASHRSRCLDERLRDVEVTHGAQSSRRVTVLLMSHRPPNHSRVRLTLPAMRSQRVLVQEHDHLLRRACSIVCVHCLTVVLTLARMLAVSIVPCATSVRRLVCSCFLMHGTVHKRVDV